MEQISGSYINLINSNNTWPIAVNTCVLNKLPEEHFISRRTKTNINLSSDRKNIKSLNNLQLIKFYLETREESIWQEIYHRVDPYVRCYINKALKSYKNVLAKEDFLSLKEDLTQETYLKLLNNDCQALKLYSGENNSGSFYCYLHKITFNLVINYFRQFKTQKRQAILCSLEEILSKSSSLPNDKASQYLCYCRLPQERLETTDLLNKAFSSYKNERNKKIFFASFILGMKSEEISKLSSFQDLSQNSIESVIRKGKKHLSSFFNLS
jgi:RNA polymerase sigma factor (sigma-70 family)